MKYLVFTLGLFMALNNSLKAQKRTERPKLVVGIIVDQMRYDYLIRFKDRYGEDGFKKLMKNGFNVENTHYNYIPTYTAVGHSSVFTGTTPSVHGIISNSWYDKVLKKSIYCVDDAKYKTIGAPSGGKKSPYRLQTTTVTDQLKLAQNMKGKTIGIAIKDRSAILPAGHTADAAYWFQGKDQGKFISSSFYMDKLPNWVNDFNNAKIVDQYLNKKWETLYPIETYTQSIADDNPYEGKFKGEKKPVFPHDLPKLKKLNKGYDLIKAVAFGNDLTNDFAKAAIVGENLGKDKYTDFITISYSSTDYVGHKYGVDSKEIEDTYLRLDRNLADLIHFLDKQVGKKNYTLFLTADHAAAQTPNYLKKLKIPGGYFENDDFVKFAKSLAKKHFKDDAIIENISNYQIFLNKSKIDSLGLNLRTIENELADRLIDFDKVYKTIPGHVLRESEFNNGLKSLVQKGYNQKFSGDIVIIPTPSVLGSGYKKTGTSHGTGYSYDTHVPLIFYGKGINKGISKKFTPITAIAPTIANLLQIEFGNGNTGAIIEAALK